MTGRARLFGRSPRKSMRGAAEASGGRGAWSVLARVRVGDVVEFRVLPSQEPQSAIYAGRDRRDPSRFLLLADGSFSLYGDDGVIGVTRRVSGGHPWSLPLPGYHQGEYDRLSAPAKVLYGALRAEYGWGHYSARGKAMWVLGDSQSGGSQEPKPPVVVARAVEVAAPVGAGHGQQGSP